MPTCADSSFPSSSPSLPPLLPLARVPALAVIYIVGTVVCSQAQTMPVFLGMRILQSLGSSAVLALGAGTLADMYDPHERGTKLGVYYACPLLGPALGPIIGGAVTAAADWRATF